MICDLSQSRLSSFGRDASWLGGDDCACGSHFVWDTKKKIWVKR